MLLSQHYEYGAITLVTIEACAVRRGFATSATLHRPSIQDLPWKFSNHQGIKSSDLLI